MARNLTCRTRPARPGCASAFRVRKFISQRCFVICALVQIKHCRHSTGNTVAANAYILCLRRDFCTKACRKPCQVVAWMLCLEAPKVKPFQGVQLCKVVFTIRHALPLPLVLSCCSVCCPCVHACPLHFAVRRQAQPFSQIIPVSMGCCAGLQSAVCPG